jgi:hypothetical protein
MEIIGRKIEKKKLSELFHSNESEFIAVYGRRRVGKTYLISEYFQEKGIYFEVTGQLSAKVSDQLENFSQSLANTFFQGIELQKPKTWKQAFNQLKNEISKASSSKKIILFFDEVPWLASRKSGFISALEYFWNTCASRYKNIKLIVCGSASSWMIQKIVNSKGGLHNRITSSIRLMPFNLVETKAFCNYRGLNLNDRQLLDIYMIMGGIPHYLRQLKKGLSATQNINEICFTKDGFLVNEFDRLYDSLFDDSKDYKTIVTALSKKRNGLVRRELLAVIGAKPGGTLNRILKNLEEAGFIDSYQAYKKKKQGMTFRLYDEYSFFYLHWIKNVERSILNDPESNYWQTRSGSQKWKIWAGYAFETICLKHIPFIKKALGISGVITREYSCNIAASKKSKGTQIDLLFDRSDNVISVCEIKCHSTEFKIDKKYAEILKNKINSIIKKTGTKKSLFLVMITINGVVKNKYYQELVDNEITLKDFFN